jgi:hypothetical protein
VTAPQIIEIGGVLCGLAKTLAKPSHASDDAVSVFVAALAAKTDHAFDTMGIDPQRFGGMAMFTRFGKLLEKSFNFTIRYSCSCNHLPSPVGVPSDFRL